MSLFGRQLRLMDCDRTIAPALPTREQFPRTWLERSFAIRSSAVATTYTTRRWRQSHCRKLRTGVSGRRPSLSLVRSRTDRHPGRSDWPFGASEIIGL